MSISRIPTLIATGHVFSPAPQRQLDLTWPMPYGTGTTPLYALPRAAQATNEVRAGLVFCRYFAVFLISCLRIQAQ
jgi:hypothetical protein